MKMIFTGRGTSGSWNIRGVELGGQIPGAKVAREVVNFRGYDLGIIVKKISPTSLNALKVSGIPYVWDIVDAWPQPEGNTWDRNTCMGWLGLQLRTLNPKAVVVGTEVMSKDCAEIGWDSLVLYHHPRPALTPNPIRQRVEAVGYEGSAHYLGPWQRVLEEEAKAADWQFVLNPSKLADVDVIVGLRCYTGYAPRYWKSNVKLANAQGSATPCIMNREQGYLETAGMGVAWADNVDELRLAFKVLSRYEVRKQASEYLLKSKLLLSELAGKYETWLHAQC